MIITIDGPSASGKSSLARELARRLGIFYFNTGLLYRAAAYILLIKNRDFFTSLDWHVTQKNLDEIAQLSYEYHEDKPQLFYREENITEFLTDHAMSKPASLVSSNRVVREALLDVQRKIGHKYDLIADGRDCGSVVFPDADYKFYLTASLEVRAQRCFSDAQRKLGNASLDEVTEELEERDYRDMYRDIAPLTVPENALIIDNSEMTFDQTVLAFLRIIRS